MSSSQKAIQPADRSNRADQPVDDRKSQGGPSAGSRARGIGRRAIAGYSTVIALGATIVLFSILTPETFLTDNNLRTILRSQAVLLIVTLGLTLALTVGEFDLSIGAVLGMSTVLIGWLNVTHGWPIEAALAVAMLAGAVIGVFNAILIVKVGITSLVATLGTSTILAGASLGITNSVVVGSVGTDFVSLMQSGPFDLPYSVYIAFAVAAALWYVYEHTPLGRYLTFVGQNREVALLSGLPVARYRAGALIATSTIAALAGVVLVGTLGSSDPTIGSSFLLPAFAGAFLGATAIKPGRFNAWGTVIALYFLVTGITGLNLMGVSGWVEQVFYGSALIIAVAIGRLVSNEQT